MEKAGNDAGRLNREAAAAFARMADVIHPGQPGRALQIRLARTKEFTEAYPARSATPNSFPIVFLDATYTLAQGDNAVTSYDRQTNASAVVLNLSPGAYIPEDTILWVFRFDERWWTFYCVGSRRCRALCKGGVAKSSPTFTVDNVYSIDGETSPTAALGDELTVTNRWHWEQDDNDPIGIEWDYNAKVWVPYVGGCKGDFTS